MSAVLNEGEAASNEQKNQTNHSNENKYSKNTSNNNTPSFLALIFIFTCAILVLYSLYLSFPKLEE